MSTEKEELKKLTRDMTDADWKKVLEKFLRDQDLLDEGENPLECALKVLVGMSTLMGELNK